MYFPCDESAVFDLNVIPEKEWRNAVVGGVLLGYKARHWWLKNCSRYPKKAKDYNHDQMLAVLQFMVKFGIKGVCHVVHLTVDLDKARKCQTDLIQPTFNQIANQPEHLKIAVRAHLEMLENMKPQTFAKAWTLLELITEGVSLYIGCVGKRQSQDQKSLTIIIDDQVEQMQRTLKSFIYYFLNCRSVDGVFSFSDGEPKTMGKYIRSGNHRKTIDLTSLINIEVGKQGDKLDNKFVELRLADIICNFMNRRFKGELPPDVCILLDKIVGNVRTVHFGDTPEYQANIPESVRAGLATLNFSYKV
jgi:hypothetical protein